MFLKEKIRLYLSTKILDIAESNTSFLHKIILKIKPLKPILLDLKTKREKQREDARLQLYKRQIPENIKIDLSSMIFAISVEYEHFDDIKLIFNKLNIEDQKTYDTIQNFIKQKDNKDYKCSVNFGAIGGKNVHNNIYNIKPIKKIPNYINSIELKYIRYMPSFAVLVLKFNLTDTITKNINILQSKKYLSEIIFKKFFPLSNLIYAYSCRWEDKTKKYINDYKDTIKNDIKKWIKNTFKLPKRTFKNSFFIDEFKIYGNPKTKYELAQWLKEYENNWLNNYGLSCPKLYKKDNFYTICSSRLIFELEPYYIKNNDKLIEGKNIDDDIISIVIMESIYFTLSKYTKKIDKIKAKTFNNIYKSSFKILYTNLSIIDLTRAMISIDRLEKELELNRIYINNKMSVLGKRINISNNSEEDCSFDKIISDRLEEIKQDLKILDNGINKILSIYNTRAILILTIAMFIVTLLGVYISFKGIK